MSSSCNSHNFIVPEVTVGAHKRYIREIFHTLVTGGTIVKDFCSEIAFVHCTGAVRSRQSNVLHTVYVSQKLNAFANNKPTTKNNIESRASCRKMSH